LISLLSMPDAELAFTLTLTLSPRRGESRATRGKNLQRSKRGLCRNSIPLSRGERARGEGEFGLTLQRGDLLNNVRALTRNRIACAPRFVFHLSPPHVYCKFMTNAIRLIAGLGAGALLAVSCRMDSTQTQVEPEGALATLRGPFEALTTNGLARHIQVLASDKFEGRAPGTPGEKLTVDYLIDHFKRLGLQPGNPNGSYTQPVPLAGITSERQGSLEVAGRTIDLRFPEDYVAVSRRFVPEIEVQNSEIIFVGYGVVAPEYGWDDYKGKDVRGKTLLMLINDPAVPLEGDSAQLDPKMFKGKAMTYYGRWTYKYEIAAAKGAAAAMIVHETGPAGYPYEVVSGSWGRENFDIKSAEGNRHKLAVESWIHLDRAKQLFGLCGLDFSSAKESARKKEFEPVFLPAKAHFRIKNQLREIASQNVIGKIPGADRRLQNEYVIYTAHWDHLGKDETLKGDQIYNGAVDNASGTAGLLELAQAYTKLQRPPKRSILFLAVTAEEKGLLGSKFYAQNPLYPLERTLANLNMDGLNQWGPTRDIISIGLGNSTLDDLLMTAAATQGRMVKPDAEPEKGYFYRSDHFEFAKQGVPALHADSGTEYIGKPLGYGEQKREEYTEKDYHKVSDEIKPDWDLAGAIQDLRLLFQVGFAVAQGKEYPQWNPGTEFKAVREKMMKRAKSP